MKQFDYILWYQSESAISDDVLIIDGKPAQGKERVEAFSFMSLATTKDSTHFWRQKFQNIDTLKKKTKVSPLTPTINIYIDNQNNILVKSHYINKDEAGRRIVFAFCTKEMSMKDLCSLLEETSQKNGRSVNPSDIEFLQSLSFESALNYKRYIIYFLILILALWLAKKIFL